MKKKIVCLFMVLILFSTSVAASANFTLPQPTLSHYYLPIVSSDGNAGFTVTVYSSDERGRTVVPTIVFVDRQLRVSGGLFEFQFRITHITGPLSVSNAVFNVNVGTSHTGSFSPLAGRSIPNPSLNTWHTLQGVHQRTAHFEFAARITFSDGQTTAPQFARILLNRTGRAWLYNHTCPVTWRQLTPPPTNWVRVPYTRVPNYRTTYQTWIRTTFNPYFTLRADQHVHHIRPVNLGGDNSIGNLMHLDAALHRGISGWFSGW